MLKSIKKILSPTHPLRLFYHKLWAIAAALRYKFPAKDMIVIGVTGTDGKTTTCTLIHNVLTSAGLKAGMTSTTEFRIGEEIFKNKTHKTTLGRFDLQKMLKRMKDEGCTHVVIETSSHAISQHRIWGIPYDVAVFTNLSPEHLDYHRTLKEYRNEKGKLFKSLSRSRKKGVPKTSIVNIDDNEFDYFRSIKTDKVISYGRKVDADIQALNEDITDKGSNFVIITTVHKIPIKLKLAGDFNIQNSLAAAAVGILFNFNEDVIRHGLEKAESVPGRMEKINEGQDFNVIIDFAMTAIGYETLLQNVRQLTDNKIWLIFGCCGDRDKSKRPAIGEIAGKMADKVIITDDEPYTEDPESIRNMIEEGIRKTKMKKNVDYFVIPDRRKAFEFAVRQACKGDTILVPGMGDLEGRTMNEGLISWSDREILKEVIKESLKEKV
jgi:UDP-N-acetylmuramoyl-L-alanyl-D-glutamate--2,6-diaminopimelate ligase